MQNHLVHSDGRVTWQVLTIVTAALAAAVSTANAGPRVEHVGPEVAVGGFAREDRTAQQFLLYRELLKVMPKGAGQDPISVALSEKDRADLAAPTPSGKPMRIGLVKQFDRSLNVTGGEFKRGAIEEAPDGSTVWAITVTSPGAAAIRVHFTDFALPVGQRCSSMERRVMPTDPTPAKAEMAPAIFGRGRSAQTPA